MVVARPTSTPVHLVSMNIKSTQYALFPGKLSSQKISLSSNLTLISISFLLTSSNKLLLVDHMCVNSLHTFAPFLHDHINFLECSAGVYTIDKNPGILILIPC